MASASSSEETRMISKKEGESAAKDKVHKINYENKDVTDYISIRNISPL